MPSYRTIPKLLQTSTCQENLIERGSYEQDVNFSYRQTANAHDSWATTNATMALIKSLKGRSVSWNQLVKNGDFNDGRTGWVVPSGQSVVVSDGVLQLTTSQASRTNFAIYQNSSFVNGHKYFINAFIRLDSQTEFPSTAKIYTGYFSSPTTWFAPSIPLINVQNKWFHYRDIIGVTKDKTAIYFSIYRSGSSLTFSSADTALFKNLMCIDLTLIYGEGNEPSTAAQFETDYQNWFGKKLTYEPYSAGEIRNFSMSGIKTTRFNQCVYPVQRRTSIPSFSETYYTKVIGGVPYHISFDISGATSWRTNMKIYDLNGILMTTPSDCIQSYSAGPGWYYQTSGKAFLNSSNNTTTSFDITFAQDLYILFYVAQGDTSSSTIVSNFTLNFKRNGVRDGDYEAHVEQTGGPNITLLTGKLNGAGNSISICPNGLLQAGDVRDEIYIQDGKRWFAKRVERRAYQSVDAQSSTMTTDGVSYTNEALATPEYYLLDDEWQDDSVWSYKVDDWGTEEVVNSSIGISTPIEGTIKYYNPLRQYSYGLRQNEIACIHDAQVVKDIYKNGTLSLHNNIWDFFPVNSALLDNGKERYFRIYSTIKGVASKPSILNIGSDISSVKIVDKSNDGNYIVGVKTNGEIETDATKYSVTLMNDYGVSFKIYLLPSDYWSIGEMTFSNATTQCEYFFIGSSVTLTVNSLDPGYIFRAPRLQGYNFSKLATYSNPTYGFPESSTVTFTYPVSYPYSVSDSYFSPIHVVDYDLSASDLDSVYTPMYSYNSEQAKGADGAHPSNFVTGQYIYIVKRTGKLLTVQNNNSSNNGFTIYSAQGVPEYSKVTINLSTGGLSNTTLA